MYRGQRGFEKTSSRPWTEQSSQIHGKQASGKQFLNRGLGNPTPIQTCLRNLGLGSTCPAFSLSQSRPGAHPPTHSGVSGSGLQDNTEEIGFPGSNFSISRVVLHLHRGEVRAADSWKGSICHLGVLSLESPSVQRTRGNAVFSVGRTVDSGLRGLQAEGTASGLALSP